jgi:hypothetical protein
MCKIASCILTKNYKTLFHPSSDRHEDIVDMYSLKDVNIKERREWLRVEIHPLKSLTSTDKKDWNFTIDEEKPLPKWFDWELANKSCKEDLIKLIKKNRYVDWAGDLYLRGTGITALPENLSVGGYLDLQGTGITALPENLSVGGYLDLRGTGITALPENLSVGGYLYLQGTGITALPENLSVGGDLDLRGTGITALPENLSVGGDLDLRGTKITALPENLSVGGYLYKDFK